MFEHLEIGAVETFTPPGELLKKAEIAQK